MRAVVDMETSRPPTAVGPYDAVVVGAGPYGLSTAAHLLGGGLKVAIFGKPMELWRDHMPRGMLLRSHGWATTLSDPEKRYNFERFLRDSKYGPGYPVPAAAFIEYARWFQERAVPNVDETYVTSIERRRDGFSLTLQDGRSVESAAVVMATGLYHYADRPEPYAGLPAGLVSHSCDLNELDRFHGTDLLIIGGGQSAIEYAALLLEAGAHVHVVSRRPILWLDRDRTNERTLVERIRAPRASIAPGWENWILDHRPYVFYRFPQHLKDKYIRGVGTPAAADWLRDRVIGKAALHEGQTVATMEVAGGKVYASVSDGARLRVDHVILATGYKVDLDKLTMIDPSLRAAIKADQGTPILNHWFESSVPGLYFIGLTSLRAFGPLYRFVAGCRAAARRVATSIHAAARLGTREFSGPDDRTMIETIHDATAFYTLRDEWDKLLERSASNSFFLTWEWLYPWWKHLSGSRRLHIVTVRSGGELIAIAPLASRPRRLVRAPFRSLEFIGADRVASDYLDLIIKRGKEAEALSAFGEYLGRENLTLEMTNVNRGSSLAADLTLELRRHGWRAVAEKTSVCPFIRLAGHGWESYLASLGPEHRYNFQRRLKNVTRQWPLRFEPVRSSAQARDALARLVALHNRRWRERGGSDAFDRPELLAFHEEVSQLALERGWLRLFVMTIDGRPVSSLYGFRYQRTFYFVQSGFDPAWRKHSVGLLAMGLSIKSAIAEGAEEYDLLRGAESYKFLWARESRDLGRLELYAPAVPLLLYKRAQAVGRTAKAMMRRTLPKTMTDRIAMARRTRGWPSLRHSRGGSSSENT